MTLSWWDPNSVENIRQNVTFTDMQKKWCYHNKRRKHRSEPPRALRCGTCQYLVPLTEPTSCAFVNSGAHFKSQICIHNWKSWSLFPCSFSYFLNFCLLSVCYELGKNPHWGNRRKEECDVSYFSQNAQFLLQLSTKEINRGHRDRTGNLGNMSIRQMLGTSNLQTNARPVLPTLSSGLSLLANIMSRHYAHYYIYDDRQTKASGLPTATVINSHCDSLWDVHLYSVSYIVLFLVSDETIRYDEERRPKSRFVIVCTRMRMSGGEWSAWMIVIVI